MKNKVLALILASTFLGPLTPAAENTPVATVNLAPFSAPVTVASAAQASPSGIFGNINSQRITLSNKTFRFRFDLDYFEQLPELNRVIWDASFAQYEPTSHLSGELSDPNDAIAKFTTSIERTFNVPDSIVGEFAFFISAKFAPITGDKVSALISCYEDCGGAHGYNAYTCLNFDLSEKKQIFFKDIFKDGCNDALEKILREHDPRSKDADFSYSEEKGEIPIPPQATENFLILPDGFLFIYSPYELDCYAAGAIMIFVPAAELRDLLK